eukprot:gnl/Chilomastix_cuspidata/966.p1 GENE.gnl/Chilomastix_cuspidata/966~~gnl/Chilomastix_cuspidata/966.p1  ORF type:complete len:462 (-),score=227.66 gnl/Chilomastix_cuspidata/966:821-2206(-)
MCHLFRAAYLHAAHRMPFTIKVISRSADEYERSHMRAPVKIHTTSNPDAHPFAKAREYTRAVRAAKMSRMFAQPFVAAMNDHHDGVYALAVHPFEQTLVASGSADGEVRIWDMSTRETLHRLTGHTAFIGGLVFAQPAPNLLFSAARDKTVRATNVQTGAEVAVFTGASAYRAVDHSFDAGQFCAAGSTVDVFDHARSTAVARLSGGSFATEAGGYAAVRYNVAECALVAACSVGCGVAFFDTRTAVPAAELTLQQRANCVCWNPQEPMNLVAGSNDGAAYQFDYRNLKIARSVHHGHLNAIMDVDFARTGREFATAGYDATVRIFPTTRGTSRDVYSARRMSKVFAVRYTTDTRFVLSGSDDANVRLWKAVADAPLKQLSAREQRAVQYRRALVKKHTHMKEVGRIDRQRPLPKRLQRLSHKRYVKRKAAKRRDESKRRHTRDPAPRVPERARHIVKADE